MTANLTLSARLFPLLLLIGSSFFARAENENNRVDNSGNRQGYWVIKAYMTNEKDYQPDATVEEGMYVDNRREGLWKKYWPGGKTKSEITYSLGKPLGDYKLYYDNGQLEEHANWQGGKQTGLFTRYHKNGNMQQLFVFSDTGKRNGLQKYYHENGQLALEVTIENGSENGVSKRYDETGQLVEEKSFINGSVKAGGIKEYEEVVADLAKPDVYNEDAGKASTVTRDHVNEATVFRPDGFNVLYDDNGLMTQTGDFKNGRLWEGKWYKYSSAGLLIRIEVYNEGKFIGTGVMEEEGK